MSRDKATIGKVLKDHGYSTSWFGKNHNTPEFQASQGGHSTNGRRAWALTISTGSSGATRTSGNQTCSATPRQSTLTSAGNPGWNLITGQADDAIEYLRRITAINSDQPFFLYYVPGAVHAPHHPTPEWIKKISDMHLFDKGWNELRETIFANQKRLGVIPQDAKMTPWPEDLLKRWDQLTPDEKKLFVRQVDVFARSDVSSKRSRTWASSTTP